jgi:hypothetical protein
MFEQPQDGRCTAIPPDLNHYHKECERITFETWASANGADLTRTTAMAPAFGIEYLDGHTQAAWAGWLAAAGVQP